MSGNRYLTDFSEILGKIQVTHPEKGTVALDDGIDEAVEKIGSLAADSRKALLLGNGGSAALVSHMQNDLCAAVGVRAMVFNEAPLLTALTNDFGHESAFKRLIELWADRGDLVIAVSSSGRSKNILNAVQAAVNQGCQVITFSGFQADNPLRAMGELNFYIGSNSYGFVEACHMTLLHALTDLAMTRRSPEKRTVV
jgi:D-sedoheptulose 7-phosphate isomerase